MGPPWRMESGLNHEGLGRQKVGFFPVRDATKSHKNDQQGQTFAHSWKSNVYRLEHHDEFQLAENEPGEERRKNATSSEAPEILHQNLQAPKLRRKVLFA